MESKFKLNDNQTLVLIILGAVVFFVFILPMLDNKSKQSADEVKESLTNTPEPTKLDKNICSRQCCKHVQWPVPHDAVTKEISDKDMKNYIGNNLSCNFGSGSGCLCVTKDDFNYLANRGSNAGKDMCGSGK
jgi:hypothetical protein